MKRLVTVLLFVSCSILMAQNGGKENTVKIENDFEKMSFKVDFEKQNYYPLETAYATFSLSNQTDAELSVSNPVFEAETKLKVTGAHKTEIYRIPNASDHIPIRFPVNFKKGDSYEKAIGLDILRREIFPSSGTYEVQFVLLSPDRQHSLESNKISITVLKPEGLNRDAYNELLKHSKYVGAFSWAYVEDEGEKHLETFVRNFGASVYGESAIYNLAMLYYSKNELEKAEHLLEKITSSKNKHIAQIAITSLNSVQKRKADLERLDRQKKP